MSELSFNLHVGEELLIMSKCLIGGLILAWAGIEGNSLVECGKKKKDAGR